MTARKTPAIPQPVPVTTVCSMCGLGWELHGKTPTTEDCIRLLKIELAKRPHYTPPVIIPQPYPVPYQPYRPYWQQPYGTWCGTTTVQNTSTAQMQAYNSCSSTPAISGRTPKPVAA